MWIYLDVLSDCVMMDGHGQGVFLAEWDGLSQGLNAGPVVVLGATNRPLDLDQVRNISSIYI